MSTFFLTLLKILLVAVVMLLLLEHAPLIMAPVLGAVATVGGFVAVMIGALMLGATLGLALVMAALVVVLTLAAALSPVWLPLLAIVGLVALCRPRRGAAGQG